MNKFQIGILFILLLTLVLRFYLFYQNISKYTNGQAVSFETRLLSEPKNSGQFQKFSVSPDGKQNIFITIPLYPQFHYGDTVRISGYVRAQTPNVPGTLQKNLLTNEKVILTIFFPKITAKGRSASGGETVQNYVLALTSIIRQKIIRLYQKTLPPTSANLLLGIVFGIKENMDKKFMDDLRVSGILHVIAASGMNVTMTAGFLSSIFAFFFRRQIALLLTIGGISFYAVLAGLEPSIVRASIMGVFVFSAQIIGRQYLAVYGLLIAGYGMLFFSPPLLFDTGFQLSFVATLGLIFIRPLFGKNELVKNTLKRFLIGEDLVTTISAQIATLPILLSNFGTYSLWSIIVNALVLWVVPTLMVFGGIAALLGIFIEPFGQVFLYATLPFLLYFEKIVNLFAGFGAVLHIAAVSWQLVLGYYFLLLAMILCMRKK